VIDFATHRPASSDQCSTICNGRRLRDTFLALPNLYAHCFGDIPRTRFLHTWPAVYSRGVRRNNRQPCLGKSRLGFASFSQISERLARRAHMQSESSSGWRAKAVKYTRRSPLVWGSRRNICLQIIYMFRPGASHDHALAFRNALLDINRAVLPPFSIFPFW
jgi:hypothetical protein